MRLTMPEAVRSRSLPVAPLGGSKVDQTTWRDFASTRKMFPLLRPKDELGTLQMEVLAPREADTKVLVYEVYRDDAAFDVHRSGPSLAQWREETAGMIAAPQWPAAPRWPSSTSSALAAAQLARSAAAGSTPSSPARSCNLATIPGSAAFRCRKHSEYPVRDPPGLPCSAKFLTRFAAAAPSSRSP